MKQEEYPEKIYVASVYEDGHKGSYVNKLGDWDCFNVEYTRSDLAENLLSHEFNRGFEEGQRYAWEEIDNEIPKWHKYPDEKPPINTKVLVCTRHNKLTIAEQYVGNPNGDVFWDGSSKFAESIIAWCNLPEPYKED